MLAGDVPVVLCEHAPAVEAIELVTDGVCPYCGKPIADHDQEPASAA